jgi:hypothetical protein
VTGCPATTARNDVTRTLSGRSAASNTSPLHLGGRLRRAQRAVAQTHRADDLRARPRLERASHAHVERQRAATGHPLQRRARRVRGPRQKLRDVEVLALDTEIGAGLRADAIHDAASLESRASEAQRK